MRVETKPSVTTTGKAGLRRAGDGQRFSLADAGQAARPTGAANAAAIGSVDNLLILQGEEDPAERRRRSLKRGHDLLDALDGLKAALLSGQVPVADLKRMALTLTERAGSSGDPRLDELIAHIELRAKVELAKLGRQKSDDR
jgi:hypothetical protein